MDIQAVTAKLTKVAQELESKSYFSRAVKVRAVCAAVADLAPMFQSDEGEKDSVVAEIQHRLPGTKIEARVHREQDAAYYDLTFRNGVKIFVNETLGGPVRTLHKETAKRPFSISLVEIDKTTGAEHLIPSGVTKSRMELIPYLQAIAKGSPKEMTQLSQNRYNKKASDMLDAIAESLEAKGFLREAYEIDKISDALNSTSI